MPKLSRHASKSAKQERMHEEMSKYKRGTLHSGSKHGPLAKSRSQAIAIGLSESGQSRKGRRKGRKGRHGRRKNRRGRR